MRKYAPTIRGLKHRPRAGGARPADVGEEIRPDNQGIETRFRHELPQGELAAIVRKYAPTIRGLKPQGGCSDATREVPVRKYAPTIRGLKRLLHLVSALIQALRVRKYAPTIRGLKHGAYATFGRNPAQKVRKYAPTIRGLKPTVGPSPSDLGPT